MEATVLKYTFYLSSLIGLSTLLFVKKIDGRTVFLQVQLYTDYRYFGAILNITSLTMV